VSFDISERTKTKYNAAWVNLLSKDAALRVLESSATKEKTVNRRNFRESLEDIVPFIVGFEPDLQNLKEDSDGGREDRDPVVSQLLTERCRGCVEVWKRDDPRVECSECGGKFHLGCFDPPFSPDTWFKVLRDGTPIVCPKCIQCRGCFGRDIAFGSHPYPPPSCLTLPPGESLVLCSMCKDAYENDHFCPNCGKSWNDVRFQKLLRQYDWDDTRGPKRRPIVAFEDSQLPITFGQFTGDEEVPKEAKVDLSFFYPETNEWGYTEVDMLVCDSCHVWTHAGCSNLSHDEYQRTSDGDHPIYSKEFLCRMCCRDRCLQIVKALEAQDRERLFALPVSEKVFPYYRDVVAHPMDLGTILNKAKSDEYFNYAWVRQLFELMVHNALTFNASVSALSCLRAAQGKILSHSFLALFLETDKVYTSLGRSEALLYRFSGQSLLKDWQSGPSRRIRCFD
jgi:Bromodomain